MNTQDTCTQELSNERLYPASLVEASNQPTVLADVNKARRIEIVQLNSGYNITVGCHQFAFETAEKMLKHLTDYLKNPQEVEKKWFSKKLDLTS